MRGSQSLYVHLNETMRQLAVSDDPRAPYKPKSEDLQVLAARYAATPPVVSESLRAILDKRKTEMLARLDSLIEK